MLLVATTIRTAMLVPTDNDGKDIRNNIYQL
jgi:hypothetical protein